MKLSDIGEFGLIRGITDRFEVPDGITGIGDDCAIIPQMDGLDTLVSTDMLVEGSHFLLEDVSPHDLGWKTVAVNLSDIAAMGGEPVGTFLSIALPRSLDTSWVDAFIEGYREISTEYGVPLLGGDTTASPGRLCLNVAVLGKCPHGSALTRNAARIGDLICVTGTLGDSSCGLKAILEDVERSEEVRYLIYRHYLPKPRVNEGAALRKCCGVHSMMDISDGIASDLLHILEASGVGAEIDETSLPLSDELLSVSTRNGWDAVEFAVSGGEDYELLFTMAPGTVPPLPFHVIGRVSEGNGIHWSGRDHIGFRHF